ncbi:MAG: Crp/Fnr family transcriptional regulator [Bacteroidia bacterium]|nr:Crp/Fnr family transcriptional regulator [Bacteroidia bacterium]
MKTILNELSKIRFFDDYHEKQLETITGMSSLKEFKVKEILFEQYDELSEVYVLLEGTLSLGISLASEKRIHLGTIEEGQLFSWSAVFSPYIATAWVMAITPAKVIAIDSKKLNQEFKKDCEFGFKTMSKIAQTISHRLSDTRFQLMNHLTL